jgi:hypothetical protein
MFNNSIPANAHNGVVAGENAKVMTEEILKGFVEEATQNRIDIEIDVLLDSVDEDIPMDDCSDFLWSEDILFNEDSYDMILEDIDAALCDEGYNINIGEWCKENDIDLKDMIYEVAEQIVEDRRYEYE